jgi:hypothetical protein
MTTLRSLVVTSRCALCWAIAIQLLLAQSGAEITFLSPRPGEKLEPGRPFDLAFGVFLQGKPVGPGVTLEIALTGATYKGDRVIKVQTDNDGRVRLVGLIPLGGPISIRVFGQLPGPSAPTLDRMMQLQVKPPPGIPGWVLKAVIIGGAAAAAGTTLAITRDGGTASGPSAPPAVTISPGTPSVRAPR